MFPKAEASGLTPVTGQVVNAAGLRDVAVVVPTVAYSMLARRHAKERGSYRSLGLSPNPR